MKRRSVPLCIILCIATFNLYSLYWILALTDDSNILSDDPEAVPGFLALLFTVITCNIYGIYWAYKMGEKLDQAYVQRGMPTQNQAILYLILELIFPIVGWALMQNAINAMIPPEGTVGCRLCGIPPVKAGSLHRLDQGFCRQVF